MRWLVCLLALAGCRNSFDSASYVSGVRLLAVVADPPELAPGESATLSALAVNPGGAAPSVTWDACLLPPPPGSGQLVNPACVTPDAGAPLVAYGSGPSVAVTMPMLALATVAQPDETNGLYLQVLEHLDAGADSLVASYGLRIHLQAFAGIVNPNPPNRNPTLLPSDDAVPAVVGSGARVTLRALVTPDSAESYVVYDGDPRTTPPRTVTETIRVHWFSTAGTFSNEVTGIAVPDTTLTLDKHLPPSGSTIDLWLVARDERGGCDTQHRTLLFR